MASLRPFFCFYGGKWRSAPKYPTPNHGQVIEPFAGAAGYSVRHHHLDVLLCDIDEVVCGVWDYLINVSPGEVIALPNIYPGQTVSDLAVTQEAAWLIGFWLNKGVARPCLSPSAWMKSGKHKTSFWGDSVKCRIAEQVQHIRHWKIKNCSFSDIGDAHGTWFIDPPYQTAGKYYRHGSKNINYADLAAWVKCRRGQVIVCENEGARWLPFREFSQEKTTRKSKKSSEALWIRQ